MKQKKEILEVLKVAKDEGIVSEIEFKHVDPSDINFFKVTNNTFLVLPLLRDPLSPALAALRRTSATLFSITSVTSPPTTRRMCKIPRIC